MAQWWQDYARCTDHEAPLHSQTVLLGHMGPGEMHLGQSGCMPARLDYKLRAGYHRLTSAPPHLVVALSAQPNRYAALPTKGIVCRTAQNTATGSKHSCSELAKACAITTCSGH